MDSNGDSGLEDLPNIEGPPPLFRVASDDPDPNLDEEIFAYESSPIEDRPNFNNLSVYEVSETSMDEMRMREAETAFQTQMRYWRRTQEVISFSNLQFYAAADVNDMLQIYRQNGNREDQRIAAKLQWKERKQQIRQRRQQMLEHVHRVHKLSKKLLRFKCACRESKIGTEIIRDLTAEARYKARYRKVEHLFKIKKNYRRQKTHKSWCPMYHSQSEARILYQPTGYSADESEELTDFGPGACVKTVWRQSNTHSPLLFDETDCPPSAEV